LVFAQTATATPFRIVVDNTSWASTALTAAQVSARQCGNGPGQCTLRRAIQLGNALGHTEDVLIEVHEDIQLPCDNIHDTACFAQISRGNMTGAAGTAAFRNNNAMINAAGRMIFSTGAWFHVTAPMTIDLDDRLLPYFPFDTPSVGIFRIQANNVSILNATQAIGGETSFEVMPGVQNLLIDGLANGQKSQIHTNNWNPERFVVLREGVRNVTVRGYEISGFTNSFDHGAIFMFQADATTPMVNITIEDIAVRQPAGTGGACSATQSGGCRPRFLHFVRGNAATAANRRDGRNVHIHGLTFDNVVLQGFNTASSRILDFTPGWGGTGGYANGMTLRDLTVRNSVFANNAGQAAAHQANISLPVGGRLQGTTRIYNNVFSTGTAGRQAIHVPSGGGTPGASVANGGPGNRPANSTVASRVYIENNHFDNFTSTQGAVHAWQTGLLTMRGNTFSRVGANPTTLEETANTGVGMFRNRNNTANQNINTWFPVGTASVIEGIANPALRRAELSPWLDPEMPMCYVELEVQRPTAAPLPGRPVDIDIFWTGANSAELLIGSLDGITSDRERIVVQVPVGELTLPTDRIPDWVPNRPPTTTRLSSETTGAMMGALRVQTQVVGLSQVQSSQYSRTVLLTGNCSPSLAISQAPGQNNPTLNRFLNFQITSSTGLDPATVMAASIDLVATPTADTTRAATLNPALINPRVISITPVPGSDYQVFDLVVAVDDSATVTATIPAGRVYSTTGLPNLVPAHATNNQITFINPLGAMPKLSSIITGGLDSTSYHLFVRPGAPVPTDDLNFTVTVEQPAGTPALLPSADSLSIPPGGNRSATSTVTATAGDVVGGTETLILHSVITSDPNFEGLLVPSVRVDLFSTDPRIRIERRAFEHPDPSNPNPSTADIMAGAEFPTGSRIMYRMPICFTWTVTNISADDWASAIEDVEVTDTDDRMGLAGLIASIDVLGIGEHRHFSECTVMVPGDTRVWSLLNDAPHVP